MPLTFIGRSRAFNDGFWLQELSKVFGGDPTAPRLLEANTRVLLDVLKNESMGKLS